MGIIRLIKPGLFIYECARIMILAVYTLFQPSDPGGFPRFIYTAPAVLFPLMALFIWLDASRYRVYLPLFAAGKCIGLFLLLCWSIITGITMTAGPSGIFLTELVILGGDLLSLTAILFIMKNSKKEVSAVKTADTSAIDDIKTPSISKSTETQALEEK
jgi:hypothetical protein